MTSFGELLKEPATSAGSHRYSIQVQKCSVPDLEFSLSTRDEQIHALVHQLFLRHISGPVRSVGFAPIEAGTETARLCFDVARTLAQEGKYDVGLIDAEI